MLPQKFSAATTPTLPLEIPGADGSPQAATNGVSTATANARQPHIEIEHSNCASRMGKLLTQLA
jgi:hypothetical protein